MASSTSNALEVGGGPWGSLADVLLCALPVFFLLFATLKKNPLPTTSSLPISAVLLAVVRLAYLSLDPLETLALMVAGVFGALTPITIVAGAIFLFECMENSGCIAWMNMAMKRLSDGHPVAEVMLIAWSFAYLIEGASGFGTPAALASPMLMALGHPALQTVVCLLLMNTFATVFGAVGTPIWFGFGDALDNDDEALIGVAWRASVAVSVSAMILVPFVVSILVPRADVLANIRFILLSTAACAVPALGISFASYDFPTLIGGAVGVAATALLIHFKVGLRPVAPRPAEPARAADQDLEQSHGMSSTEGGALDVGDPRESGLTSGTDTTVSPAQSSADEDKEQAALTLRDAVLRTMPLWLTVCLLVLTRVDSVGLKGVLRARYPRGVLELGTFGDFWVSAGLVVGLDNILDASRVAWSYEVLYVPFILPFVIAGSVALLVFRKELQTTPRAIMHTVSNRMAKPAVSLVGALALVQLLRGSPGDLGSPAAIIGINLARSLRDGWVAIAALIGALGSFFSGSTTVSNLTFASVQVFAAQEIGVDIRSMLALQTCGSTLGNAVCLNNIIAASAVVKLAATEGEVMRLTGPIAFGFYIISTAVLIPFLYAS